MICLMGAAIVAMPMPALTLIRLQVVRKGHEEWRLPLTPAEVGIAQVPWESAATAS